MAKKTTFQFSTALQQIDEIVSALENQEHIDLEKSVEQVEKGLLLIEVCRKHLQTVENKVEKLKVKFDKDALAEEDAPEELF